MYTKIITIPKKQALILNDILNLADKNTFKRLEPNVVQVDYDDDWIIEELVRHDVVIISQTFNY
jgi:hypothetical protein